MRKSTLFFLFALMWMPGKGAWALDQKDGIYQIGSVNDLATFAELVNGGEVNAKALLISDIDLSQSEFCLADMEVIDNPA